MCCPSRCLCRFCSDPHHILQTHHTLLMSHSGTAWACWDLSLFTEETNCSAGFQLLTKAVSTVCKTRDFLTFLRTNVEGWRMLVPGSFPRQGQGQEQGQGHSGRLLCMTLCGEGPTATTASLCQSLTPRHHPAPSLGKLRHSCVIFKEIAVLAKARLWGHFSRTQSRVFRPPAFPSGWAGTQGS